MNNIIIIRGDVLAIGTRPGDFGGFNNQSFLSVDLEELMMSTGMYFPTSDQSFDLLPVLKHGINETIVSDPVNTKGVHLGIKGVLAAPEDGTVQWYSVRASARGGEAGTILTQIPTGVNGFSALSSFTQLSEQAIACLRLTDNIRDAVEMYCRHTGGNPNHVTYYSRKKVYTLIREFYKKKGWLSDQTKKNSEAPVRDSGQKQLPGTGNRVPGRTRVRSRAG